MSRCRDHNRLGVGVSLAIELDSCGVDYLAVCCAGSLGCLACDSCFDCLGVRIIIFASELCGCRSCASPSPSWSAELVSKLVDLDCLCVGIGLAICPYSMASL